MKQLMFAVAASMATAAAFAGDVGTLGGLGEPGYGQIDIHKFPKPQVVFPEPVVIRQVDTGVAGEPVYLRVPPEHAKDWRGSEKGRGGEKGRSWGSPDHLKKKKK